MENATGTDQRNEPASASRPRPDVEGFLDRAQDQLTQAEKQLGYSNKQEAQEARYHCALAIEAIDEARAALREG